jgi:leucyl-tRNA synthetase
MILGDLEYTAYQRSDGSWISASEVTTRDGRTVARDTGDAVHPVKIAAEQTQKQGEGFVLAANPSVRLESRAYKMSKARGNVINPDAVVAEYGADALRLYEMFMGPLEATKPWSMAGVNGVRGFLDRVWRMIVNDRSEALELNPAVQSCQPTTEQNRVLHRTIAGVTEDIEGLRFNTAIAKMMEFTNYFTKADPRPKEAMEQFVLLLSPFAPHIAEELWQLLGHGDTLAYENWPVADPRLLQEETVEIPVQIQGKVRSRIQAPVDAPADQLEALARADARIRELLSGRQVVKVVVVPGRLVNFVMG